MIDMSNEQTNTSGATDELRRPYRNGQDTTAADPIDKLAKETGARRAGKPDPYDPDAPGFMERAKAEITRLAHLVELDYEIQRGAAAKKLGLSVKNLDRIVAIERPNKSNYASRNAEQLQGALDLLTDQLQSWAMNHDTKLAYAGGSWRVHKNGHWRIADELFKDLMERLLHDISRDVGLVFAEKATMIYRHLQSSNCFAIDVSELDRRPYVAVRNGTIDLDSGKLLAHSADHNITRFIDIEYDPTAKCDGWVGMLLEALGKFDENDRPRIAGLIQEWMGLALFGGANERTPRALRKILFLYGPPNSGKSTILDVVRALLGTDRIVASRISEVTNNEFGLEAFLSAQAWITDEAEDMKRQLTSNRIKCLVTGEPMDVQRKGVKNVSGFRFHGPIAWAGNTRPKFTESSGAVYDRVIVVPMEQTFSPEQSKAKFGNLRPIEWLKDRGELPGIVNWALAGYRRLLERGMFEDIEVLRAARDSWREQDDVAYEFIQKYTEPDPEVRNVSEVLAWAAHAYAKVARPSLPPAIRSLQHDIKNVVAELYPAVKHKIATRRKVSTYDGLALTEGGIKYFEQAMSDHPTVRDSDKLTVNERPIGGRGAGRQGPSAIV